MERNHRTVKRMAARVGGDVRDMVVFYNTSPNQKGVVPAETIYKYVPSRCVQEVRTSTSCPYSCGDLVYVRPPNARCTTAWALGTVSGVNSDVSIVVDGVPRHVRDLRKATAHDEVGQEDACDDDLVGFTYDSDDTACDQGSDGGDESSDYGVSLAIVGMSQVVVVVVVVVTLHACVQHHCVDLFGIVAHLRGSGTFIMIVRTMHGGYNSCGCGFSYDLEIRGRCELLACTRCCILAEYGRRQFWELSSRGNLTACAGGRKEGCLPVAGVERSVEFWVSFVRASVCCSVGLLIYVSVL